MHPKVNILGTHINSINNNDLLAALTQVILQWRTQVNLTSSVTDTTNEPIN